MSGIAAVGVVGFVLAQARLVHIWITNADCASKTNVY